MIDASKIRPLQATDWATWHARGVGRAWRTWPAWIVALAAAGAVASCLFLSRTAAAHTVMTMPVPRVTGMTGSGLTMGPCGGTSAARTATQPVAQLTAGASLDMTWSETITHPGCFLIDFSTADDMNFMPITTLPHNGAGNVPRSYATTVTLPATPCAACTLRIRQIQLAADPAAGTCPQTGVVTYFSCANVALAGPGGVPDAGAPEVGGGGTGGRGASGSGGATGSGGRVGGGTGGRAGTGGSVGTGGTTVLGSGGATAGTGGATPGSTGSSTGGSSTGPAAGSAGNPGSPGSGGTSPPGATGADQSGGCACAVASASRLPGSILLTVVFVALAWRRSRVRRNQKP